MLQERRSKKNTKTGSQNYPDAMTKRTLTSWEMFAAKQLDRQIDGSLNEYNYR